jgi:hypothetical protein
MHKAIHLVFVLPDGVTAVNNKKMCFMQHSYFEPEFKNT